MNGNLINLHKMNALRLISSFIIFILINQSIDAQSIINGDMELGPIGTSSVPTGWDAVAGTPDHCNGLASSCSGLSYKIPTSSPQGGKWVRIFRVGTSINNEIFGQQFSTPLVIGNEYVISFFASISRLNSYVASPTNASIIVGFSNGIPSNQVGDFNRDTLNLNQDEVWISHSYSFIATGAYDYISFGKLEMENTNALYVDDVSFSSTLPVNFNSFDLIKKGKSIDVKWETSNSKSIDYFELERSSDLLNWELIEEVKSVKSNASVNYNSEDINPLKGISYYRIKQVDNSGKINFSKIKSAEISSPFSLKISPNPVVNNLSINCDKQINMISIYNEIGQLVHFDSNVFSNDLIINTESFIPGFYLLIADSENETVKSKFVVK